MKEGKEKKMATYLTNKGQGMFSVASFRGGRERSFSAEKRKWIIKRDKRGDIMLTPKTALEKPRDLSCVTLAQYSPATIHLHPLIIRRGAAALCFALHVLRAL